MRWGKVPIHLSKSTPIIFPLLNSDNNSNTKHNISGKVISDDDDDCVYDSIS